MDAMADRFVSRRTGERRWVLVRRRRGLDEAHAATVLAGIADVDWTALYHAYGPASDVPALLYAVTVGDDQTRKEAWWGLWSKLHHQGSVYEAALPAVDVLIALAMWREYPDRVQALRMLRGLAGSEDVRVWRYGAGGEIAHDGRRQREVRSALLAAVQPRARELVGTWREEPEGVRRAQLWLLSSLPACLHQYRELVDVVLPAQYRETWRCLVSGEALDEAQWNRLDELEAWVAKPDGHA